RPRRDRPELSRNHAAAAQCLVPGGRIAALGRDLLTPAGTLLKLSIAACNPVGRMAEGVGFEPTMELPPYTLSRRAPSTARPPLRAASGPHGWGGAGREPECSKAPAGAQRGHAASQPLIAPCDGEAVRSVNCDRNP